MGKFDHEQYLSASTSSVEVAEESDSSNNGCQICKFISFRCILVLLFSVPLVIFSIFWLPPFVIDGDRRDLDPELQFRGKIEARFTLRKPVSFLSANILKLEYDIFEEISVVNSTVTIISLEPLSGSNWTNVVFGVIPSAKNSIISSTGLSVLRSYFVSFVIQQSKLHLTSSLFGDASSFQVLKFPGGITVIPQQNAFLLQKVPFLFNFTLNYSIYQIQEHFDQLKNQLKSGLHLTSFENLYISLTNLNGSTLAPPMIVRASVLPAIGSRLPSPRLKQLAQTITSSPARNLGLNHTVFGKVKQIQLSSFLQHSLNGSTSGGISQSPSPAPPPHSKHHHHHHHHHHHVHHHHDDHDKRLAPTPSPAPAPQQRYGVPPPSGCRFAFGRKPQGKRAHFAPAMAPMTSPHHSAVPRQHVDPHAAPRQHVDPPAPASLSVPGSSPRPAVFFAQVQPPSKSNANAYPPDGASAPLSSSSSVAAPAVLWASMLLGALLMHA